jgi:hypothetical protein
MSCILFTGCLNNRGYGQVRRKGKTFLAHRVAYTEHHGIPLSELRGLVIRHRCDTPKCVNPDHLVIGTQKQNIGDAIERGRHVPPPHKTGENVGTSVLTETDVKEIKRLLRLGVYQRVIAERFGVSQVQISHIKLGKQWSHV